MEKMALRQRPRELNMTNTTQCPKCLQTIVFGNIHLCPMDKPLEPWKDIRKRVSTHNEAMCKAVSGTPERIKVNPTDTRGRHVGNSDYSSHKIQPWHIWEEYNLNGWDADIAKRLLRTKVDAGMTPTEQRILDYKKIIHNCEERIRQLDQTTRSQRTASLKDTPV